jgi:hypothetical protein
MVRSVVRLLSSVVRLFSFCAEAGLVALALAATGVSSCGNDYNGDLCNSIKASADGLHTSNCSNGIVTLSQVTTDASGARTFFAFVVSCGNGKSAHGTWSSANGLSCSDGIYAVCDGGMCTPTSSADCVVSTNCTELGQCGYADGGCVLTDDGCAHSAIPCGLSGLCHLGPDGVCVATTDTDCQNTCQGCAFKGPCATTGRCSQVGGACVARQDSDCKKSEQCAFAGLCTLQGDACIASTDSDCTTSEVCRTAGQCMAVKGRCGVK